MDRMIRHYHGSQPWIKLMEHHPGPSSCGSITDRHQGLGPTSWSIIVIVMAQRRHRLYALIICTGLVPMAGAFVGCAGFREAVSSATEYVSNHPLCVFAPAQPVPACGPSGARAACEQRSELFILRPSCVTPCCAIILSEARLNAHGGSSGASKLGPVWTMFGQIRTEFGQVRT